MPFNPAHEAHAIDRVSATVIFSPDPLTTAEWLPVLLATHSIAEKSGFKDFQEGIVASFVLATQPGIMATATT